MVPFPVLSLCPNNCIKTEKKFPQCFLSKYWGNLKQYSSLKNYSITAANPPFLAIFIWITSPFFTLFMRFT